MWILEVFCMYNKVTEEYKECMRAPLRNRMHMAVSLGVVNQDAQGNGKFTSDLAEWSDSKSPWGNKKADIEYATLEENYFKADGSMYFLPEPEEAQYNPNVGIASKNVLEPIEITFPLVYDIKGLTIDFGRAYPTKFKIITAEKEYTYTNNAELFTTKDNLGRTATIKIVPVTMVGGQQRLRINNILMGIGLNYTNNEIQSMNMTENINAISKELSSVDFDLTIVDLDGIYDVDNDDSFINYLQTGQEVNVSIGLELDNQYIEYVPIASLLLSKWDAQKDTISFRAVDKFVLMDDEYKGGTIHNRTLYDDAVEVLKYCGFEPDEYIIDDCLRDVRVVNPLPRSSAKELLQIIANAGRCICYQDREGKIVYKANFATVIDPEDVDITAVGAAEWSKPDNVTKGTDYLYADLTENFFKADGSMYFLPENGEKYLETGYVSEQVADASGHFHENIIKYPYANSNLTKNGLKFTDNGDGSIHVEGTATADTWFGFRNNGSDDRYPMWAENAPYKLGDILQADLFIQGDCNGTIGIVGGYKTTSSPSTQGYIFNRNHKVEMENGKTVFSCVKKQDIDPLTKTGMKITAYMYIKKDCVLDLDFSPTVTVRHSFGDLLVNPPYRAITRTVDNAYEMNGITYTLLDDGGILVNGKTANKVSAYEFYSQSERQTFEKGHTYKLTEGRDVTGHHTNPYIQWIRYNSDTAKFDYDLNTANGDKTYTHTDDNLSTYAVRIVVDKNQTVDNVILYPKLIDVADYDENETRPTHYVSGDKPSLTMELQAGFTYYGIKVKFDGNPPQQMLIDTYYLGKHLQTVTVDNPEKEANIEHAFVTFDKMVFTFPLGAPNDRVLINRISFGALTDYKLNYDNIVGDVKGLRETKIKNVLVKVFTYTTDKEGQPQVVEDNVYYTHNLNSVGTNITVENPLISTLEQAQTVAEWIGFYYSNNVSYTAEYRGDPILNASDLVFLESKMLSNLQVEIESHKLSFDGTLSGQLELRRAIRTETT